MITQSSSNETHENHHHQQPDVVTDVTLDEEEQVEEEVVIEDDKDEDETIFLHNLCILPPLQKDDDNNNGIISNKITQDAILLPTISPSEPVSAIRNALGELRGYAHITNYRLVIEKINVDLHSSIIAHHHQSLKKKGNSSNDNDNNNDKVQDDVFTNHNNDNHHHNGSNGNNEEGLKKKKKKKKQGKDSNNGISTSSSSSLVSDDVVSPYTSNKAAIKVSSSLLSLNNNDDPISHSTREKKSNEEEVVLNDFGDLSPYVMSEQLNSNMGLRMVLERYDVGLVKEHVAKTRFLLNGNAPCVLRVVGEEDEEDEKVGRDKESVSDNDDSAEMKIPDYPLNKPVSVNGNNLKDFFYLACGEEERLNILQGQENSKFINLQKINDPNNYGKDVVKSEMSKAQIDELRWGELDDLCHIKCTITYSGFNPPPSHRLLYGDLAYLEVLLPDTQTKIHVTATHTGFYINRSSFSKFDPKPTADPCFSHTLLDCLLKYSTSLRCAWSKALEASIERSDLAATNDSPVDVLFRAIVKRDLNKNNDNNSNAKDQVDSLTLRPSWLVHYVDNNEDQDAFHKYNIERAEDELCNTHGLDVGAGMARDWNDELQSAREMPSENLGEKIERARIIHKTLLEFGDAAVAGAMAIFKGQITPMNPNEPSRSQVYLHNNIFFSRAIDSGVDTFKISQGDLCARKAASREAQSVGTFHRLDIPGLNTLATVLIDYLGTRLFCQSIVPGILQGDKTHEILYGAVEATSQLRFDKDFHDILEKKLGRGLMIASRNVQKSPLCQERLDYIEERKTPSMPGIYQSDTNNDKDVDGFTKFFGPIEMKGIKGSDKRTYCLDLTRLTPRDANWVPKILGGTGNFDSHKQNKRSHIPDSLHDEEWMMAVLRPELIINFTHKKMREWIEGKKKKDFNSQDGEGGDNKEKDVEDGNTSEMSDSEYMDSLRMNLNVFIPHLRGPDGLEDHDLVQLKLDESRAREAALFLWDTVLPGITQDIKSGTITSIPADGRGLTEFLHQRGVNCRYLGRLAEMAMNEESKMEEEEKGVLEGNGKTLQRHKMPEYWLELLECEMVARAAKHVLESYLTESGCLVASKPGDTIASFLSALMIKSEESAAETEKRLSSDKANNDDEQTSVLAFGCEGDTAFKRGHKEIWNDIENEIGRRFRYSLCLFNSKDNVKSKRAQYIPLLRRFCQKTGIRLKTRSYQVGDKGLVSSSISYPIAISDIVEIVPLVKHAASSGDDGFVPCASGAAGTSASLHVLLPEAKAAFDAAQVHLNEQRLQSALELIQEATSLYQRIVESPFHVRVYRCLELTSIILFQAQELDLALANANKALSIAIQIGGFDCKEALSARTTLSHILLNAGSFASAVKQQRTTMYLMELMAGPRYVELSNSYYKLGTIYHEVGSLLNALRFYQEAYSRNNPDRVVEGMLNKHSGNILASLGQYKAALETEKRTYDIFRLSLGEDHELSKTSMNAMKNYANLSVQQQKQIEAERVKVEEENKKRAEELAAVAVGNKMVAEEAAAAEKKKKKKKKSGKKKK